MLCRNAIHLTYYSSGPAHWVTTQSKVRIHNVQLVTVSALKKALRWILLKGGKTNCKSLYFDKLRHYNFYFYLNLELIQILKQFQNLENLYFENSLFSNEMFDELMTFPKLINLRFMEQTIPVCIDMQRRNRLKRFSYRCLRSRTHDETDDDMRAFWSLRNKIMKKRRAAGLEVNALYVLHTEMYALNAIMGELGDSFTDECVNPMNE